MPHDEKHFKSMADGRTSTEHLAAAAANFSIGRARPDIVGMVLGLLPRIGEVSAPFGRLATVPARIPEDEEGRTLWEACVD